MSCITGYYVTCDDAECVTCFNRSGGEDVWRDAGGFEGWPGPLAIESDSEADTPTHCAVCETLILHNLTSDGLDYVREAAERLAAGGGGRPEIVQAWLDEYGHLL